MYGHACSELTAVRYTLRFLAVSRARACRWEYGMHGVWNPRTLGMMHTAHHPNQAGHPAAAMPSISLASRLVSVQSQYLTPWLPTFPSARTLYPGFALIIHPPYVPRRHHIGTGKREVITRTMRACMVHRVLRAIVKRGGNLACFIRNNQHLACFDVSTHFFYKRRKEILHTSSAKKILILFLQFLFPTSLKEIFNIASL